MSEFNERTAQNRRLHEDEAQTIYNRIKAKLRQSARRINRAYRKSITISFPGSEKRICACGFPFAAGGSGPHER